MELDAGLWGTVLLGAAVLLLARSYLANGRAKRREDVSSSKGAPREGAVSREEPAPREKEVDAPAPDGNKPARPPKAIVWQVPQPDSLDDDDITVIRAIPVFDDPAEISFTEAPDPKEADDGSEPELDRVSRVELRYEAGAEAEEVTAASARILIYAASGSDRGRVRARNEDSMLVMPERSLFAVADGMGGHRGGEVASSLAIDTLEDAFHRSDFEAHVRAGADVPRRARELAAAVQMTNECVRSMALADRELADMGTTLVAARFSPNKQRLYVGHVGDSRCYRLRRGKLRQLTTDHTMKSLGMEGPRSQDLYQAVGVSPGIMIDLIVDKPQDDDTYLLCSDGLSKMLSDDRIRDVLLEHEDLESALHTLIQEANDRGGKDNVTVIVIKVLSRASKKALDSLARQVATS